MPSLREMMAAKAGTATKAEPAKPADAGIKIAGNVPDSQGKFEGANLPEARDPRQLTQTDEKNNEIPMVFPSENWSEEEKAWWQACFAVETDMGIVIDGDHAWIALKRYKDTAKNLPGGVLLLHKLPLLNRHLLGQPF